MVKPVRRLVGCCGLECRKTKFGGSREPPPGRPWSGLILAALILPCSLLLHRICDQVQMIFLVLIRVWVDAITGPSLASGFSSPEMVPRRQLEFPIPLSWRIESQ